MVASRGGALPPRRLLLVAVLVTAAAALAVCDARRLFARQRSSPTACGACVFAKRPDLAPFYQKNGWNPADKGKILDDWCGKVAPADCEKAKKELCAAECGANGAVTGPDGAAAPGGDAGPGAAPGGGGGDGAAGPPMVTGAGSWSVLPFQGSHPVWQMFGDTCFARGNGARYYKATGGMHNGIDFGMPCGTAVYAVCDGTVFSAAGANPFGAGPQSVIIKCNDGKYALYGHLSKVVAQKGATITTGAQVGNSGTPDSPSNCHLHFEVRPASGPHPTVVINPATCFSGAQKAFFDSQVSKTKFCSNIAAQQYDMARPPAKPKCAVAC